MGKVIGNENSNKPIRDHLNGKKTFMCIIIQGIYAASLHRQGLCFDIVEVRASVLKHIPNSILPNHGQQRFHSF